MSSCIIILKGNVGNIVTIEEVGEEYLKRHVFVVNFCVRESFSEINFMVGLCEPQRAHALNWCH